MTRRAAALGMLATLVLASLYVGVVSGLSGWSGMLNQFRRYWYFLLPLWLGFGFQVGLYASLRQVIRSQRSSKTLVAASGTGSTAAMLACCTHYLATLVPILGASGLVAFVSQYQAELFWVALLTNVAGIAFMLVRWQQVNQRIRPVPFGRTVL